jgi:nitrogenase subunit NifH
MAKKTKTKNADTKVNVNLDELVNEGKNLTEEVVAEETAKAAEVKKKLVEETAKETDVSESWKKCAEELNNLKTTDTPNKELEKLYEPMAMANDNTTEDVAQVEQIEEETAKEGEVTDNIDDVIAECTGKADEKVEEKNEEKKTTKDDEPWYVARAMRGNDYFNW